MKTSIKAALISAFVFPGAGHFFLKKYTVGTLLAGISSAILYVVISKTVERALQIADKIQSGEVQPQLAAIAEFIASQPVGAEDQLLSVATYVLLGAWLCGIIDSYRVGRAQGKDAGMGGA